MGTHITEESWFGRIGGAFKGILFGGIIAIVSVPLLFWNEGRAVRTAKGLKEGGKVVVDIKPDTVETSNEGKFVHTSGMVETEDVLEDSRFGVSYRDGIKLVRHVEMYQWAEDKETRTEKKLGGGKKTITQYTYHKGWYTGLIDSNGFDEPEHRNPSEVLFSPQSQQAKEVRLGAFRLPDSFISMIDGMEVVEIDESNIPGGHSAGARILRDGPNGAPRIYISSNVSTPSNSNSLKLASQDPPANPGRPDLIDLESSTETSTASEPAIQSDAGGEPQIGDVRVWFTATPVTTVSLLSQQTGETFQPFETHYGTTIHTLKNGTYSADEMIAQAEAANRALTWVLRAVGTFAMFLGLVLILRPLAVIADVLPIAGSLVGFGSAIVAGLLTIAGSMTVIGVAWVFYRPVLGVSLLVVAGGALFLLFKRGKGKNRPQPETLTAADLA